MPIFSHKFSGLFLGKRKAKPQPLVIEDELGTFTMKNPETDKYFCSPPPTNLPKRTEPSKRGEAVRATAKGKPSPKKNSCAA